MSTRYVAIYPKSLVNELDDDRGLPFAVVGDTVWIAVHEGKGQPPVEPIETRERPDDWIPFGDRIPAKPHHIWPRVSVEDALEGGSVWGVYRVNVENRTTSKGDPMISAELSDATGSVRATKFDETASDELLSASYAKVWGKVGEYNGKPTVRLSWIQAVDDPEDERPFIRSSVFDRSHLVSVLQSNVPEKLAWYLDEALGDWIETAFEGAQASRSNHHDFALGLAEHVASMLGLADLVVSHYQRMYDDPINADVVRAAVLLHDAFKVYAYSDGKLTKSERLFGHIAQAAVRLDHAQSAYPINQEMHEMIVHCVLSHHGRREWGSPVEPATMEAEIVHAVDRLDARLATYRDHAPGPGKMSDRIWSLDGSIYTPDYGG